MDQQNLEKEKQLIYAKANDIIKNQLKKTFSESAAHSEEVTQETLPLLFNLAEQHHNSKSSVNHGVSCNYCGMSPIRGVRYRCLECPDFDMCAGCEANSIHNKFHQLLVIKIHLPLNYTPRIYGGLDLPSTENLQDGPPEAFSQVEKMPEDKIKALALQLLVFPNYVRYKLEKFYNLADIYQTDGDRVIYGISKGRFLSFFHPPLENKHLSNTFFRFYDKDKDGLIGAEEYIRGQHIIASENSKQYIIGKFIIFLNNQ